MPYVKDEGPYRPVHPHSDPAVSARQYIVHYPLIVQACDGGADTFARMRTLV